MQMMELFERSGTYINYVSCQAYPVRLARYIVYINRQSYSRIFQIIEIILCWLPKPD